MKDKNKRGVIAAARRSCGLTQRDIAVLLGHSSNTGIARVEQGKNLPTADHLIALCLILKRPSSEIIPDVVRSMQQQLRKNAQQLMRSYGYKTPPQSFSKIRRHETLKRLAHNLDK